MKAWAPGIAAPGKLVLIGEYAVLEGAPAVVMAVNRYAFLQTRPDGQGERAGLVHLARQACARRLAFAELDCVAQADSSAFYLRGLKLGLGSSGAVATVAVASVFLEAGYDIEVSAVRLKIWRVALGIHNAFQCAKGSGIDLAASIFGDVLQMTRPKDSSLPVFSPVTLPARLRPLVLWTGRPASTPRFLQAVKRFQEQDPRGYANIVSRMSDQAGAFCAGDPLQAFEGYAALMEELGVSARVPIVSGEMKILIHSARRNGGAAKPSGAGGGDLMVALFPRDADPGDFLAGAKRLGFEPVELEVATRGVHTLAADSSRTGAPIPREIDS